MFSTEHQPKEGVFKWNLHMLQPKNCKVYWAVASSFTGCSQEGSELYFGWAGPGLAVYLLLVWSSKQLFPCLWCGRWKIKDAERLKKLIKKAQSGAGLKRRSLEELAEGRIHSRQQCTMAPFPSEKHWTKSRARSETDSYSPAAPTKATSHPNCSDNAVQRLPVTATGYLQTGPFHKRFFRFMLRSVLCVTYFTY